MGFIDRLSGKSAGRAAIGAAGIQAESIDKAIAERQRASEQGLGFLQPFSGVGQQGLE